MLWIPTLFQMVSVCQRGRERPQLGGDGWQQGEEQPVAEGSQNQGILHSHHWHEVSGGSEVGLIHRYLMRKLIKLCLQPLWSLLLGKQMSLNTISRSILFCLLSLYIHIYIYMGVVTTLIQRVSGGGTGVVATALLPRMSGGGGGVATTILQNPPKGDGRRRGGVVTPPPPPRGARGKKFKGFKKVKRGV